jgi:hypothetical protein
MELLLLFALFSVLVALGGNTNHVDATDTPTLAEAELAISMLRREGVTSCINTDVSDGDSTTVTPVVCPANTIPLNPFGGWNAGTGRTPSIHPGAVTITTTDRRYDTSNNLALPTANNDARSAKANSFSGDVNCLASGTSDAASLNDGKFGQPWVSCDNKMAHVRLDLGAEVHISTIQFGWNRLSTTNEFRDYGRFTVTVAGVGGHFSRVADSYVPRTYAMVADSEALGFDSVIRAGDTIEIHFALAIRVRYIQLKFFSNAIAIDEVQVFREEIAPQSPRCCQSPLTCVAECCVKASATDVCRSGGGVLNKRREVCCAASCKRCRESDCEARDGGAAACCPTYISNAGRACENGGAPPCVLRVQQRLPRVPPFFDYTYSPHYDFAPYQFSGISVSPSHLVAPGTVVTVAVTVQIGYLKGTIRGSGGTIVFWWQGLNGVPSLLPGCITSRYTSSYTFTLTAPSAAGTYNLNAFESSNSCKWSIEYFETWRHLASSSRLLEHIVFASIYVDTKPQDVVPLPTPALPPVYVDCVACTSVSAYMISMGLLTPDGLSATPLGRGITSLMLPDPARQLKGTIPSALSQMVLLRELKIAGAESVTGTLPIGVARLPQLEYLNFDHCQLSGGVPTSLFASNSLRWAHLRGNKFTGPIFVPTGNDRSLTHIDFSGNDSELCFDDAATAAAFSGISMCGLVIDSSTIDSDPNCARGILNSNGDVCCSAECGSKCGGSGCSDRPGGASSCCNKAIRDAGRLCTDNSAPCVHKPAPIDDEPPVVPMPSPASADPTCALGTLSSSGAVCCPSTCVTCGGSGCASGCCGKSIKQAAQSCSFYSAPCVMNAAATPPVTASDATCARGILNRGGDVCCSSSCGSKCGGSGCAERPGSSVACCSGPVRTAGVYCTDAESPCLMSAVD